MDLCRSLKPEDYLAVIAYDLRPEILSDFSTGPHAGAGSVVSGCAFRRFPKRICTTRWCSRANGCRTSKDARRSCCSHSGVDTFSKLTFDKTRRAVQDNGVPIYAIGLAASAARDERGDEAGDGGGDGGHESGGVERADEDVRERKREGRAFFPRFDQADAGRFSRWCRIRMRSNYTLTYQPTNQTKDGKFRRLKVELVNPETNEPLRVVDEKGQADQSADRDEGRLQSSARSGIAGQESA